MNPFRLFRGQRLSLAGFLLAAVSGGPVGIQANPVGGTVSQGTASFTTSGSQFTIHTSDHTWINWQSFNIGLGQTTTFIQPSSSSVVWNQINDPNPSQILGNLNANGYVVLLNPSGFFIGGQASIATRGLLMTTAAIPMTDLSGGGAWDFKAPPPTASIINYGQINVGHGGSAFLIADNVENHGGISAPAGQIGLFAGKEVLLSERPDGRGLSAQVTLPQGCVDNTGSLIADAGTIAMHAQVVNQGGVVQANAVREVNGVVELVASDAINLGPGSQISTRGDSQGTSSGGSVLIKSAGTFSDAPASVVDISGGAQGGNGGRVEISAPEMSAIQSSIYGQASGGFVGGKLFIDPLNIVLANSGSTAPASGTVGASDPPAAGTLTLDVSSFSKTLSQITLQAANNIELSTLWNLADPGAAATLNLSAGNNIILDNGSGIKAANNWSVNLVAGTQLASGSRPAAGNDGIYLKGNSFISTQYGNISLWAANEVIVNPGPPYALGTGSPGNNGVRTLHGGNIQVTAEYGDVNTGGNYNGFIFGQQTAPYYKVSPNLGGISTFAGGDVTITAGGNVTSYLPVQSDYNHAQFDGGTGAFGSLPGNVTITAGRNVTGHYVLADGIGTVTAGGDIGASIASGGFALSLIKGGWNISAPNGNLYLQDVRNPDGIFNDKGGSVAGNPGYHFFNYDPLSSLTLQAGKSIEITGAGAPHDVPSSPGISIPIILPPSLRVSAGSGGFILDSDVILFPSAQGELQVQTFNGGDFKSYVDPNDLTTPNIFTLSMSDSAARHWLPNGNVSTFGLNDHAATPSELHDLNPVQITIAGSMDNVTLRTTKATHITVGHDMFNASLLGQNLHPNDTTSITVAGKISYSPLYAFTHLSQGIAGFDPGNPSWDAIFSFMVDPSVSLQVTAAVLAMTPEERTAYAESHVRLVLRDSYHLQPGYDPNANPGFIYDAATGQLGFQYQMSSSVLSALDKAAIPILKLDPSGNVIVEHHADGKYYFATTTTSFVSRSSLENLHKQSLSSVKNQVPPGLQIGGPGQFNITAGSMDLGSSGGLISWGIGSSFNPINYSFLSGVTASGAAINLNVAGDLTLLSSTIASIDGGALVVKSGGAVNLSLGDFSLIPQGAAVCFGIFTSGHSDVSVTARESINVGGARIAAFNGGNVFVKSEDGSVNAGNGANSILVVPVIRRDPVTGFLVSDAIANPRPFGSGIIAISPTAQYLAPGNSGLPGNITVDTPQGNIVSTLGGIQQFALNGTVIGGPTITLTAGTAPSGGSPGYAGNIDLGSGGVIGGTININAQGSVKGLIIAQQNANITASQSFSGTVLSSGAATISAGGSISGTVIGIGGVNASGGAGISAALLGQNVSVGGGAAQSTLGTTAAATSTSQAAAQQASSETQQQVASNTTSQDDDEKKKRAQHPTLLRRVGRVTVILPPAS